MILMFGQLISWKQKLIICGQMRTGSHGFCVVVQRSLAKRLLQQRTKHHGKEQWRVLDINMECTWTQDLCTYQHCHDLHYDKFGSVKRLQNQQETKRMAPHSDDNLETILWNKVPVKSQKEVGQIIEGSLQEMFQKLLKGRKNSERKSADLIKGAQKEESFKASVSQHQNFFQTYCRTLLSFGY